MKNLAGMLKQASQMQQKMEEMQAVASASIALPPLGIARANRAADMRRAPKPGEDALLLAEWQQLLAVA